MSMPRVQASTPARAALWALAALALLAAALLRDVALAADSSAPARQTGVRRSAEHASPPSSVASVAEQDGNPSLAAQQPGDPQPLPAGGPLYQPGEPQLTEDQPDWVGPACEDDGVSFWQHLLLLPPSNGRYRAIGDPLIHESWLNRPLSISLLTGGVFFDNPIRGHVNGSPGYLYGFRLGWDVDYWWGLETRFAYSVSGARSANGLGSFGNMKTLFWDTDLLWYPWGDTRWRPFFLVGLGLVDYKFPADTGFQVHQTTFGVPFGGGFKYRHNNRWAFRLDVLDNLTFRSGGGMNTMNNISVTASIEGHFAIGPKRSYWPWNPTRSFH